VRRFINRGSPLIVLAVACFTGNNGAVTVHGSEMGSLSGSFPDPFQERPGNATHKMFVKDHFAFPG
jgi:hypothetical protein